MPIRPVGGHPQFGSAYRIKGSLHNNTLKEAFPDASWAYSDATAVPGKRIKSIVPIGGVGRVARIEASMALDSRIEGLLERLGIRFEKVNLLTLWLQHLGKEIGESPVKERMDILDAGVRRVTRRMRDYEDPHWEATPAAIQQAVNEAEIPSTAVEMLLQAFQRTASK